MCQLCAFVQRYQQRNPSASRLLDTKQFSSLIVTDRRTTPGQNATNKAQKKRNNQEQSRQN